MNIFLLIIESSSRYSFTLWSLAHCSIDSNLFYTAKFLIYLLSAIFIEKIWQYEPWGRRARRTANEKAMKPEPTDVPSNSAMVTQPSWLYESTMCNVAQKPGRSYPPTPNSWSCGPMGTFARSLRDAASMERLVSFESTYSILFDWKFLNCLLL